MRKHYLIALRIAQYQYVCIYAHLRDFKFKYKVEWNTFNSSKLDFQLNLSCYHLL